jgi:putative DNA primase/helicase
VADAIEEDGWGLDEITAQLDQARPAPTKLVCVTAAEFVTMKLPERTPIFGPFLSRQSLVMAYAERGIGKTWLAMNIAYAIATGGKWLKWSAARPCNVLYLDGEMPAPWFQERWQKIMASPQTRDMERSLRLRLVTPDLQKETMPDIGSEEGRGYIAELLGGVEVVIVDNISTLVRTGVENEAESWIPIQDWALDLRRRGIAVLFVHHAGKSGQQRGTSKREDTLDSVLSLRHPEGYEPDEGARFEIHFEKSRGFAGKDAEPVLGWMETDRDGLVSWMWEPCHGGQREKARVLAAEGKSIREIASLLGLAKSTVERWLKKTQP